MAAVSVPPTLPPTRKFNWPVNDKNLSKPINRRGHPREVYTTAALHAHTLYTHISSRRTRCARNANDLFGPRIEWLGRVCKYYVKSARYTVVHVLRIYV